MSVLLSVCLIAASVKRVNCHAIAERNMMRIKKLSVIIGKSPLLSSIVIGQNGHLLTKQVRI